MSVRMVDSEDGGGGGGTVSVRMVGVGLSVRMVGVGPQTGGGTTDSVSEDGGGGTTDRGWDHRQCQ